MKGQLLAIAVVIAIFSGVSHADSCAAGPFSSLLGTSCTIAGTLFTFSAVPSSGIGGNVAASALTFTPESSATSSGFGITGFPWTPSTSALFYDYFTAVPSIGTITSSTATLNVSQDSAPYNQVTYAVLYDLTGSGAYDEYSNLGRRNNSSCPICGWPRIQLWYGCLGWIFLAFQFKH